MRTKILVIIGLVGLASTVHAKDPKPYKTGTLMRMEAVHCGTDERDGKSLGGELLGTDSGSKKSKELLCQEYVLQSDTLVYRLRPTDEKHPALLPIGEHAQFRLDKDKMVLRVEDLDDKDREYIVVSIAPRTDETNPSAVAGNDDHRMAMTPLK